MPKTVQRRRRVVDDAWIGAVCVRATPAVLTLGSRQPIMGIFERNPARKGGAAAEAAAGAGLLGSLKKRSGGLMDRVAGSVMEAARGSLLKQAMEARERGNLAAAFHLAKEECDNQPDEPQAAGFFWDVAVDYERPADAASAVVGLIRKNILGAHELATQYWVELDGLVPSAPIDPATLIRLLPHLEKQIEQDRRVNDPEIAEGKEPNAEIVMAREARAARESALRSAIRGIVDESNRDSLTAGVAMHVAELARELDPASALAAARHALDCEDVHQTKRERLQALVAELDPNAPAPPPPPPEEQPAASPEPAAHPPSPHETAAVERSRAVENLSRGLDSSDTCETEVHPARNHPLREQPSTRPGLSDDEVAALQKRLPPSRSTQPLDGHTGAGVSTDAPNLDQEPVAELEPDPESADVLDLAILGDSAPDLEIDDLDLTQPLDEDFDELAQSFPELKIEGQPAVPVDERGPGTPAEIVEGSVAFGSDRSETTEALAALDPEPDSVCESEPVVELVQPVAASIPIDMSVAAPIFPDLKRMPAQPTGLDETALLIQVAGARRARIELDQVQAIAVGEVIGLADLPVLIVDLLMDVRDGDGTPLRLVRLRGDEFDPRTMMTGETDIGAAFQAFLGTLMERTRAIPLPDPEAALGLIVPRFDSLDDYERQVLQVRR